MSDIIRSFSNTLDDKEPLLTVKCGRVFLRLTIKHYLIFWSTLTYTFTHSATINGILQVLQFVLGGG